MFDKLKNSELRLSEIINMAFSVFKEQFKNFFGIALIIGMPINLVMILVLSQFKLANITVNLQDIVKDADAATAFLESSQFSQLMLYYGIWEFLRGLLYPLMLLATAHLTMEAIEGRVPDYKKSALAAFEKGPVLVAASVVYMLVVYGGMCLFLIPGVIFIVWLYFYSYAIILDNETAMGALKKSFFLTKNRFGKTAVKLLPLLLLKYALNNIASRVFMSGYNLSMTFVSECVGNVIDIFIWCAITLLYVNIRDYKYYGQQDI